MTVDPRDYEARCDPALAASLPSDLRVVRARACRRRDASGRHWRSRAARLSRACGAEVVQLLARRRSTSCSSRLYPAYTALLGPLLKRRFDIPFVLDYQIPGWRVGQQRRTWRRRPSGVCAPDQPIRRRAGWSPFALRAADGVTAVSRADLSNPHFAGIQALPARGRRGCRSDGNDRDFAQLRAPVTAVHGSRRRRSCASPASERLPPTMTRDARGVFRRAAAVRERHPSAARRIRIDFIGTSNQRTDRRAATACAGRLARTAARRRRSRDRNSGRSTTSTRLQAFPRDADALLLLGTREAHYTPSRIYAALHSARR